MADVKTDPAGGAGDFYDSTYGRFGEEVYREVRRETWGEDIGQNGWITADEQDRFIGWLGLAPGRRVLDVACGSGGPTLRLAQRTGARVLGVDVNPAAVREGREQAGARGLAGIASFEVADAAAGLGLPEGSFDAVLCVDAINHLGDRLRVLAEWARLVKPGGRVLFTDPVVVTGPLTKEEIAIRSAIGAFVFVAPDSDERLLAGAGWRLVLKEDLSEAVSRIGGRWHAARESRSATLRRIEGDGRCEGQQRFLEVCATLARERRLSRFAYVAEKA